MKEDLEIVVLPGDGIGPEIIHQTINLIEVIKYYTPFKINVDIIPCGGKYYLEHRKEWPDDTFSKCSKADAILLGAVGHEIDGKPVMTDVGFPYSESRLAGYAAVIGNRIKLDLYANVRPIKLYNGIRPKIGNRLNEIWAPEQVDYVIVRENTEDAYCGDSSFSENKVVSPIIITREATQKIVRFAFNLARKRSKLKKVTCVDKSNIIAAHRFFREIFTEIGKSEFSDLSLDFYYVDAFCVAQITNPEQFDVVVAPNLVGDIISDNGAITQGGLGVSASGNIGDNNAMFEAVHGSANSIAGLNKANPIASFLALKMMLEWLSLKDQYKQLKSIANYLEQAVIRAIEDNILTFDLVDNNQLSYSTSYVGHYIKNQFNNLLKNNL